MTLTAFAAILESTIKYCHIGLATGLNDGSSWANAWQTFEAVMAAEVAGNCVAFKSVSTARTTVVQPTVAGTATAPIVWVAVDDSDNVVDADNWEGYGGTVGVVIDFTGSGTTQDGFYTANTITFRYFFGFAALESGRNGIYAYGSNSIWCFCRTYSSATRGLYPQVSSQALFNHVIVENESVGSLNMIGDMSAYVNVIFKNCTTALTGSGRCKVINCIFIGCTTAANHSNVGYIGCEFYNCGVCIKPPTATNMFVFNCLFDSCTTVLTNTAGNNSTIFTFNLKYCNCTNYIVENSANLFVIDFDGQSSELLGTVMVDPANENFTPNFLLNSPSQAMFKLNALTKHYPQAGLTQYSYNNVSTEDIAPNGLVVGSLGGGGSKSRQGEIIGIKRGIF
jgi:hypothetical protein